MRKDDKSIDINFIQYSNMLVISTTEDVLIFPKLIFCKFVQFLNIEFIFSTLELSKFDKSISIMLVKKLNIFSHELISSSNIKVTLFKSFGKSQYFLHVSFLTLFT